MATKTIQVQAITNSVNISADAARRLVNQTIVPDLGTGLGAREPDLMLRDGRVVWRVPIELSLPQLGDLGEVGMVDVDADTGRVITDKDAQVKILEHAQRLYAGAASLSSE